MLSDASEVMGKADMEANNLRDFPGDLFPEVPSQNAVHHLYM